MSGLLWRWCTVLFACAVLSACTDTGVVGINPSCAKACPHDQLCHPTLFMCVECVKADDCSARSRSDDGKPYCDTHAFACVACRDGDDCSTDKPYCVHGECKDSSDDNSASSDDHAAGAAGSDDHAAGTGGSHGNAGKGDE